MPDIQVKSPKQNQTQEQKRVYMNMSEETEQLFRKWLKIQVAQFYISGFLRLLIFLFVVGSIVFSTYTLAPFIAEQMETWKNLQSGLGLINSFGDKPENPEIKQVDSFESLSDEQKEELIQQFLEQSKR